MAEDIILSTGKQVYANLGILGIAPDLSIYEGYDGIIYDQDANPWSDDWLPALTPAELEEIATIAISRWQRFKEKVRERKTGV